MAYPFDDDDQADENQADEVEEPKTVFVSGSGVTRGAEALPALDDEDEDGE